MAITDLGIGFIVGTCIIVICSIGAYIYYLNKNKNNPVLPYTTGSYIAQPTYTGSQTYYVQPTYTSSQTYNVQPASSSITTGNPLQEWIDSMNRAEEEEKNRLKEKKLQEEKKYKEKEKKRDREIQEKRRQIYLQQSSIRGADNPYYYDSNTERYEAYNSWAPY